jgi:ATP-dependent DNA helicase RecG
MRPAILNRLFAEARVLPGIGPKIEKLIAKALGAGARAPRVLDLVFHLPAGLIDRRYRPKLIAAEPGRIATVMVNVLDHKPAVRGRRLPYRVLTTDDTAAMEIVYFTPHEDHILKMLPPGSRRVLSGRIDSFSGRLQMAHPDYIAPPEDAGAIPDVEAVYPTTDALSARVMGKAVRHALERIPELPEWQDESYRAKQGWPNFSGALGAVHGPRSEKDLEPLFAPRMRLAYDELLANQLALALIRDGVRRQPGRALKSPGTLRRKAISALPFQLTEAQTKAILEITADMESSSRMVGSCKATSAPGRPWSRWRRFSTLSRRATRAHSWRRPKSLPASIWLPWREWPRPRGFGSRC